MKRPTWVEVKSRKEKIVQLQDKRGKPLQPKGCLSLEELLAIDKKRPR